MRPERAAVSSAMDIEMTEEEWIAMWSAREGIAFESLDEVREYYRLNPPAEKENPAG